MKAKSFFLTGLEELQKANAYLLGVILDGKVKVTFSNAGTKTLKQNNLWHMWCEDVAISGIGGEHEDSKGGVHLVGKYKFVLPILERDDTLFAELWKGWYLKNQYDRERLEYFVEHHVSTTVLNKTQMAEALTGFKNYYAIKHGVNLRQPEFRGLLD